MITERARVAPRPIYDRVSFGFPGVIRLGKALTAHNLVYIGAGNAKSLKFGLPAQVKLVSNDLAMKGGNWL